MSEKPMNQPQAQSTGDGASRTPWTFTGFFLLEDLVYCLDDLEELAARLQDWATKARAMHEDGVRMREAAPDVQSELWLGTDDPDVAARWELQREDDRTPLNLFTMPDEPPLPKSRAQPESGPGIIASKDRDQDDGPLTPAMIQDYLHRCQRVRRALSDTTHPWHRRHLFLQRQLKQLVDRRAWLLPDQEQHVTQHATCRTYVLLNRLRDRVAQLLESSSPIPCMVPTVTDHTLGSTPSLRAAVSRPQGSLQDVQH